MTTTPEGADKQLIQPNAENRYDVTPDDLPLSCPMPGMYLWNSHPKVYLPIEKERVSSVLIAERFSRSSPAEFA